MVSIVFFVRKFKVFFVGSLIVGDIVIYLSILINIISKYNLKIVNMMKKKFKWVLV